MRPQARHQLRAVNGSALRTQWKVCISEWCSRFPEWWRCNVYGWWCFYFIRTQKHNAKNRAQQQLSFTNRHKIKLFSINVQRSETRLHWRKLKRIQFLWLHLISVYRNAIESILTQHITKNLISSCQNQSRPARQDKTFTGLNFGFRKVSITTLSVSSMEPEKHCRLLIMRQIKS